MTLRRRIPQENRYCTESELGQGDNTHEDTTEGTTDEGHVLLRG